MAASTIPEVKLANAPLVQVLAQVRFSYTPEIVDVQIEQRLHEILAGYPIRHVEDISISLPGGEPQAARNFRLTAEDQHWTITLAPDFIALETSSYTTRTEFIDRLTAAMRALERVSKPPLVERVGVRYVDRIDSEADLDRLGELLRPSLLGWSSIPDVEAGGTVANLEQSTQAVLRVDSDTVLVRSFLLPAGAAYDPSVPLSKSRSWLLDIDAADVSNQPFEASALGSTASRLADRCHSVFRWSVTEAFLDRFR